MTSERTRTPDADRPGDGTSDEAPAGTKPTSAEATDQEPSEEPGGGPLKVLSITKEKE